MDILEKNAISQPLFRIIAKEKDLSGLTFPAWIKRGNGWSCHKNDIRYATNEKEAAEAIADMRNRGIETFIHTVHCQGDIIKFYGVGSDYFTYSYPNADKTKFGLEKFNGETSTTLLTQKPCTALLQKRQEYLYRFYKKM